MNTTGLTDDEMRVRIARFCGWLEIEDKSSHLMMSEGTFVFGYPPTGAIIGCKAALPDYLNDLNAMHAAEKTLAKEQRKAWILALAKVLYEEHPGDELNLVSATARQRALAFLAMLPEPEAGR